MFTTYSDINYVNKRLITPLWFICADVTNRIAIAQLKSMGYYEMSLPIYSHICRKIRRFLSQDPYKH